MARRNFNLASIPLVIESSGRKLPGRANQALIGCGLLLLLPLILITCGRAPEGVPREPADPSRLTLYFNGTILTMTEGQPQVEGMAVRGEKIEATGSDEEILALKDGAAALIDLDGRVLMPGFVDAHTHLLNDHRSQGLSLDEAQYQALKNGITSLGTLYVDESFLREIQTFDESGFLRVRSGLYLVASDPCGSEKGAWWKEHPPSRVPGEMLRINGVKIFADGGSCGRVALSFELQPGQGTGDLWFTQDELQAMVAEVDAAGYQAAIHAIGDRAVVQALDVLETVLAGRPNTLHHRMEHVSVIPPEQIARFGELGIVPVLIGEYPSCTPYGPPIPGQYAQMEWPWRALREENPGLPLAWHTDVPFQSPNPFDHLLGFATRLDTAGRAVCPPAEALLDDTLPVEEALSMMTIQSAYALGRDEEVGSLAPGKYADFIVLAANPLSVEPAKLAENRVLLTVVGGRTEYCWPASQELCPGFANRTAVPLPDLRPPTAVRWLAAALLLFLPLAAMATRRRYASHMQPISGFSGILAGAIWLALLFMSFFPLWNEDTSMLLLTLPAFLMAVGTTGIAALWRRGWFGTLALWLALLGAIAFSESSVVSGWFRNDLGWGLFILGLLGHAIGLILFGSVNLRGRVFPRWNALPLIVGLLVLLPLASSSMLPESSDWPIRMLLGVLGGGWLVIGWLTIQAPRDSSHEQMNDAEQVVL